MQNLNEFINTAINEAAQGRDKNNPILKYLQANVLTDKMIEDWFKKLSKAKIENIRWARGNDFSTCAIAAQMTEKEALDLANEITGSNAKGYMSWGEMLDKYYTGLDSRAKASVFANNSKKGEFLVIFYLYDKDFKDDIIAAMPFKFPEFGNVGPNTDAIGQPVAVNDIVAYLPKGASKMPELAAIVKFGRAVTIMTIQGNEVSCKNTQIVKIPQQ